MSSSSASYNYGCEECYCYGVDSNNQGFGRVWQYPFCSNAVEPLVYYAQVAPPFKQPISRDKEDNPNFFVKAFKWYTEEHLPPQRNQFPKTTPNMNGFATWLDTKYRQFLQDSYIDKTTHLYKQQQTTNLETNGKINNNHSQSRKKKSRVRSPWKKLQNLNKENGDNTSQKSQHSFKYILQPKEITRNASEWCQLTPTSLRNRSNVTIVSADVCDCKKETKSLSLTSVKQEKKSNEIYIAKTVKQKSAEESLRAHGKLKDDETILKRDISCQCAEENVSKVSTGTEYEDLVNTIIYEEGRLKEKKLIPSQFRESSDSKLETSLSELPKKGIVRKIVQEFDPRRHVLCQCSDNVVKVDAYIQYDGDVTAWNTYVAQATETAAPVDKRLQNNVKSAVTNTFVELNSKIIMNSEVQTSDHCINLGTDLIQQYPFFMRFVCADKLCADCVDRQNQLI